MIIISSDIVKIDSLINQYNWSDIERYILTKMDLGKGRYEYTSLAQLQFELKLRENIIYAAKKMSAGNMEFSTFRKSTRNPDYWDRTAEGGFIVKKGIYPSDAIRDIDINSSKYATECATAMVIIYYQALLNIYGDKLFNNVFPEIQLMNWHYLNSPIEDVGYMSKRSDYLPGDRQYFNNPDVNPTTPEWQGENVINLGNELYYGHGIGIGNADLIINELNDFRKENANTSAYLLDSAGRPDFNYLANIYNDSKMM